MMKNVENIDIQKVQGIKDTQLKSADNKKI
jgi:hypothetical protein